MLACASCLCSGNLIRRFQTFPRIFRQKFTLIFLHFFTSYARFIHFHAIYRIYVNFNLLRCLCKLFQLCMFYLGYFQHKMFYKAKPASRQTSGSATVTSAQNSENLSKSPLHFHINVVDLWFPSLFNSHVSLFRITTVLHLHDRAGNGSKYARRARSATEIWGLCEGVASTAALLVFTSSGFIVKSARVDIRNKFCSHKEQSSIKKKSSN